jgi:mercuric ion transport protein
MNDRTLLTTGIVGAVVAALCCFTPVLAILLGAVGLSAVLRYLDFALFPAIIIFIGMAICAVARQRRA